MSALVCVCYSDNGAQIRTPKFICNVFFALERWDSDLITVLINHLIFAYSVSMCLLTCRHVPYVSVIIWVVGEQRCPHELTMTKAIQRKRCAICCLLAYFLFDFVSSGVLCLCNSSLWGPCGCAIQCLYRGTRRNGWMEIQDGVVRGYKYTYNGMPYLATGH